VGRKMNIPNTDYRTGWANDNVLDLCSGGVAFKPQSERCRDWGFSYFSSDHRGKYRYSTSIWPQPLPSKSLPIHHSPISLSFGAT
jgi:hypothetical protein